MKEFDLDAALKRRPRLLLVDEYAHTNVPGSRHPKRWQDIDEILTAGIDVWSTLNIQHLESLNDVVQKITKVRVRETVPDTVFDKADEKMCIRDSMTRVFNGERTFLSAVLVPLEKALYWAGGVDDKREQHWLTYTVAMLLFHVGGFFIICLLYTSRCV